MVFNWRENYGTNGFAAARFDSDGWIGTSNLTGYWQFGKVRVSPAVGVSFTRTDDEAHVDSAGRTYPSRITRTGTFTVSGTLGYTVASGDGRSLEAFVTPAGEKEFKNTGESSAGPGWDMRVTGGAEMSLPGNKTLAVNGFAGGLVRDRYESYGLNANFAFRF